MAEVQASTPGIGPENFRCVRGRLINLGHAE